MNEFINSFDENLTFQGVTVAVENYSSQIHLSDFLITVFTRVIYAIA